jgi:hypothetical protein
VYVKDQSDLLVTTIRSTVFLIQRASEFFFVTFFKFGRFNFRAGAGTPEVN